MIETKVIRLTTVSDFLGVNHQEFIYSMSPYAYMRQRESLAHHLSTYGLMEKDIELILSNNVISSPPIFEIMFNYFIRPPKVVKGIILDLGLEANQFSEHSEANLIFLASLYKIEGLKGISKAISELEEMIYLRQGIIVKVNFNPDSL